MVGRVGVRQQDTQRRTPTTSKILGTPRRHEPCAPLARPGQGAGSAQTAGSGVRVVYGGLRHARSEGGEGAAGRVGVIALPVGTDDQGAQRCILGRQRITGLGTGVGAKLADRRIAANIAKLPELLWKV